VKEPGGVRERRELMARLYPLTRSITGDGVRETLRIVGERVPLEVTEVASGTPVLDWVVPPEWTLRRAFVDGPDGQRIVDVADHNLHVVSYSQPVDTTLTREELLPHLHSLPTQPDLVPYRTSYWNEGWGFCLRHRDVEALPEGDYRVCIDASLGPGSLTYGECVVPGATDDVVLVSVHVCHPSLANDNLSGIAAAVGVHDHWVTAPRRHTLRVVFLPATIGSITWLANNRASLDRIRAGVVLSGVADPSPPHWKRSRRGGTVVDRAFEHVLAGVDGSQLVDYYPYGYDERQYCSPGFDLPVGRYGRGIHGEYAEYHTSADDLAFVSDDQLTESIALVGAALDAVDANVTYRNLSPEGEPQLGRRGLYRAIGGDIDRRSTEMGLLWVLAYSDGTHDLLDIARLAGLPFASVRAAADALHEADLLAVV
jgi:aminopeptidase-like protein